MPEQSKAKKVDISFTNWVLGGSLVSVTDGQGRRRMSARKVAVLEVTDGKPLKIATSETKMESKTTAIGSHGDGNKIMAMGKQGDQKQVKQDVGKEAGGGAQECCKECGQASDNTTSQTNYDKKKDWRSNKAKVDDAKKDDPKEDEIKNANDTERQGFTDAQDAKIKQMKANNKSWNDIAIEVGVSKKDVTARYKKLRETEDKKKAENDTKGDSVGLDFDSLFLDDDWGVTSKPSDGVEEGKRNLGSSKAGDNTKANGKYPRFDKFRHSCGSELINGGNTSAGNWNNGGPVGGYPELKSNSVWSEADCDLLMFLEARYMEEKWLQMQAGFFNWTGRMVDAEIIKAKFAEDGL